MKVPTIEPLEARIAPAVLTITPVQSHTDEGSTVGSTTDVEFKITLDTIEAQDITVLATLKDGTAKVGDGDFSAFSQTITIPKGETEWTFKVPIRQDTVIEGDETFSVELSSPSANATIGDGSAEATIRNDDKPLVTIQAVDTALNEGSSASGTTNFRFNVKLNVAAAEDVKVWVTLKDGTAKLADGDFAEFTQEVIIPAGQLSAEVNVPIKQDFEKEGNETFEVELSLPEASTGAQLGGTTKATVTILNDDPPSLSIADATVVEGAAGETSQLRFLVKLNGPANEPITFDWRTAAGSASGGIDFSNIELQTVTIPAGQTEVELVVNVHGDNLDEVDETVRAFITNARLGAEVLTITDGDATGRIKNDELSVSLTGPGTITEGNPALDEEGNPDPDAPTVTNANYTLTLSQASTHGVLVQLEVVDGTGKVNSDFTLPPLNISIPAGQTSANFTIPIKIDTIFEGDETYVVRIKSVTDAVAGSADAVTTTILNDDAKPQVSVVSQTVSEGTGKTQVQLRVNLSHAAGDDITFDWSTVAGTATAGVDFTGITNQTVTIPAGSLFATLVLDLEGDEFYEGNETLTIAVANLSDNAVFADGGQTGTITIDEREAAPTLRIADASAAEGAGTLTFVVSLPTDQKASKDITFDWVAAFGTATAGVDYAATPGTITIPAGQNSVTFSVTLLDDAVMELDETFFVSIGNATFGSGDSAEALVLADDQATGKIVNDERQITISAPTILEGDPVVPVEGEEPPPPNIARYEITLTDGLGNPMSSDRPVTVTLQFDAEASTAELADIQLPPNMTVTIPAGQTSAFFDVTIRADDVFEGDETIVFKVVSTGASADPTVTATITENEAAPKLIVSDSTIEEGANGVVVRKVKIQLSGKAEQDVTFDWSTVDGTALAGQDYTRNLAGKATIPAGSTEVELSIALSGDTVDEADEHFFINISNALMGESTPVAMADDAQAKVTIQNDDLKVRIAGATLVEGTGETPSNLVFTISIPQASTHDVTVTIELGADGETAEKGVDYLVPENLTVTIPAGQTAMTFAVPVVGDTLSEGSESFTAKIAQSTNAAVEVGTATGTITDDDNAPILTIGDQSVVEGADGTKTVNFTIQLDKAAGRDVTVLVTPTAGTASLGADFSGQAKEIKIPAGELSYTFAVTVNGDTRYESDETFSVVLSGATGATIGDGTATGTITNDDPLPTITITADPRLEGNSGTSTISFVISMSSASDTPVKFKAKTVDGTALAGSDYTAKEQEFTIPAGQTSATFTVSIAGDTLFEANEFFNVDLLNLEGATLSALGTGTIVDEDTPQLSIGDLTVTEGGEGTKTVDVIVSMSATASRDVQFNWAAIAGTAMPGQDYVAPTGSTITIPAGQTSAKITFTVIGDTADELDKDFTVNISDAKMVGSGQTPDIALSIADPSAKVTILNDDVSLSFVGDVTIVESDSGELAMTFTVKLSAKSNHPVTVMVSTQDGTAVSTGDAADFTAINGMLLTFDPEEENDTEKTVTILVKGDLNYDGTDTFKVLLSSPTNAAITDGEAVGTITDDDTRPVIGIVGDVSRFENNVETDTSTTKFQFVVKLDRASDEFVQVSFSTIAGTAAAGSDFTAINNQLITFQPGQTEQTITVDVQNDTIWEANETFKVSLSNPLNASIGVDKERTGTILTDAAPDTVNDIKPKLRVLSQSVVEGDNGEKFLSFVVERTGVTQTDLSFNFIAESLTGDAAIAGEDYEYEMPAEPITMAADETTKTVMVKILGDGDIEGDQTFTVRLDDIVGAEAESATAATAKGTILDDDVLVRLAPGAYTITEGNAGQRNLVFLVNLDKVSTVDTTITYTLASGSASSGSDFINPSVLSLVIPAGETAGEIRVPVIGDTTAEPNETFTVNLTGATNAELASSNTSATGTILNDDATLIVSDAEIVEGGMVGEDGEIRHMVFKITLQDATNFPVTVRYATSTGSATAGTDFTSTQGEVTFVLGGPTTIDVLVPVIGDNIAEGTESLTLTLSNAIGATILDGTATGKILDHDTAHLRVGDATLTEGNDGLTYMDFDVTLVGTPTGEAVTVDYSTVDGTAKSSGPLVDYLARNGSLRFEPGQTTQTIRVPVIGDTWKEVTEAFSVKLSNARLGDSASNIVIDDDTAAGQIVDDGDTILGVFVNSAKAAEGSGRIQFVVETTAPTTSEITLQASTIPGTAGAADFTALNGTSFTIAAGQSTATVNVTITNDAVFEQSEYLVLEVSGFGEQVVPVDGSGGRVTANGVILNDDINIISAREFEYIDKDGDLVHVKFSKGTLSVALDAGTAAKDISWVLDSTVGGRSLSLINLSDDRSEFEGASITITAKPQILVTGEVLGDGKANVGTIAAMALEDNVSEISTGIGLQSVKIDGDLGRVFAGSFVRNLGIGTLEIDSLGTAAAANATTSIIFGPVGRMVVHGDIVGSFNVLGDVPGQPGVGIGKIGKLIIEGALRGGSGTGSGQIAVTSGIGSAVVGEIVGGAGSSSGSITAISGLFSPSIGKLTVLGDVKGGAGASSGTVSGMLKIGTVTLGKFGSGNSDISGNLIGGSGADSGQVSAGIIGSVSINGDLRGGGGEESGLLRSGTTMGNVRITGDIAGGSALASGVLVAGAIRGKLAVEGSIVGGDGNQSGLVAIQGYSLGVAPNTQEFEGNVGSIVLGKSGVSGSGNLIGGDGDNSGKILVQDNVNSFLGYGDFKATEATGAGVAGLDIGGTLKTGVIKGSIFGGNSDKATTANRPVGSGFVSANQIGSLTIEGKLQSGAEATRSNAFSAGIHSDTSINSLKIGSIDGNKDVPVVISAISRIGKLSVGGDVEYAEILAGYNRTTDLTKSRGVLTNAGATIDSVVVDGKWIGSSLVAGVYAGPDGKFGTADDTETTNGSAAPLHQNLISRIASVVIKSTAEAPADAPTNATYGIVANEVRFVSVGGAKQDLTAGASNDPLAATLPNSRLQIFEI